MQTKANLKSPQKQAGKPHGETVIDASKLETSFFLNKHLDDFI